AVSHLPPGRRLELLAEARRLAEAQGFSAEVSCGLQQRQCRGYNAYKGGLRLWDGERLEALEQRSALVQSLATPVEWAWLIHPAEVAPKLRQLISD
ncbi:MAG: HD family phosphohydrolase, partial [Cyanobium sp.]